MNRRRRAPAEPALSWAVAAGASADTVRGAWSTGWSAEVPVGRLWEVVRVNRAYGLLALERLRHREVRLGLVLEVLPRATVEFLVPVGSARSWPPLLLAPCADAGTMSWPPPNAAPWTGLRSVCGRRWLAVPPVGRALTTDADALCEAIGSALAHRTWE